MEPLVRLNGIRETSYTSDFVNQSTGFFHMSASFIQKGDDILFFNSTGLLHLICHSIPQLSSQRLISSGNFATSSSFQVTTNKMQRFLIFYFYRCSTCFRRFPRPSSGACAPDDGRSNRLKHVQHL